MARHRNFPHYFDDDPQLKKDLEKTLDLVGDTVLDLSNTQYMSKVTAKAIIKNVDALLYMRDVVEAKNWTYEKDVKDKDKNVIKRKTITRGGNDILAMEILWDLDQGSQRKNQKLIGHAAIMNRLKKYNKAYEDRAEIGTHYTAIYYADKYLGAETSLSKAIKEKQAKEKKLVRLPVRGR